MTIVGLGNMAEKFHNEGGPPSSPLGPRPTPSSIAVEPLPAPVHHGEFYVEDKFHQVSDLVQYETLDNDVAREELGEEPRNIILSMISQVSRGMDLHKIAFPTFVLEPRSMLERITDFMAHPCLILQTPMEDDPVQRFLDVVKYYISGWHVRPKGVKKPYNPVLGEFFRCQWKIGSCDSMSSSSSAPASPSTQDSSTSFYIGEQVSHHPPISAYIYANPEKHIIAMGNLKPKGRFLGNSVMSALQGTGHLFFTNRPGEEYIITNPNIYARGILFGTMLMELGDAVTIRCEATDLIAEIEFKVKGYFSGTYNAITGVIKRISTGAVVYEITGKWTDTIYYNKPKENPMVLINVNECPLTRKLVASLEHQDPFESRRLWQHVTAAINNKDYGAASEEKGKVENAQRSLTKLREDANVDWRPKFFRLGSDDFWYYLDRHVLKENPQEAIHNLQELFFAHYEIGAQTAA